MLKKVKNIPALILAGLIIFISCSTGNNSNCSPFEIEGMGLRHYFYRTDNILIWWQVEPDKAVATFNDLFKFDFATLKKRVIT